MVDDTDWTVEKRGGQPVLGHSQGCSMRVHRREDVLAWVVAEGWEGKGKLKCF